LIQVVKISYETGSLNVSLEWTGSSVFLFLERQALFY